MKAIQPKSLMWLSLFPVLAIAVLVYINNGSQATSSPTTQTTKEQTVSSNTTQQQASQVLTVTPERCRGCGKCVRIDAEHFQMSGRTSTVISQKNLSSAALAQAMQACHDQAISLT